MSETREDIHTQFFDWLQAAPSHQHAYFELSEMWARSACTKSMSDMIEKSVILPFPTQTDKPSHTLLTEPTFGEQTADSSWAYTLAIGLIFCGLIIPAIQAFL
jgi:ferric-dicitrate binding protein FerR (iron transport regulator)